MSTAPAFSPAFARVVRRSALALIGVWAWETLLAVAVTLPFVSLARSAYGADYRGDAPLWQPGAHALLDLIWRHEARLGASERWAMGALAGAMVVGLAPLAVLLATLSVADSSEPHLSQANAARSAVRALPALVLLFGLASLLILSIGGLAAALWVALPSPWTVRLLGEAREEQARLVVVAIAVLAASVVGVVHDLARAAAVRFGTGGFAALSTATRTFAGAPARLWAAWAWRSAASLVPVVGASYVADELGGRGGSSLALLATAHQAAIISRVVMRSWWLTAALRALGRTQEAAHGAQDDPSDR